MAVTLDEILISSAREDFREQIDALRQRLIEAAWFGLDSDEYSDVLEIVRDVGSRGDEALIELTEKHDNVKLTPETLKVSKQELKTKALIAARPPGVGRIRSAAISTPYSRLSRSVAASVTTVRPVRATRRRLPGGSFIWP